MKTVELEIKLGFVELKDFISDAWPWERSEAGMSQRTVLVGGMVLKGQF